jgi:hypothetical protein
MYIDKTIIPYVVKIKDKILLKIDTKRFDCIAMDYDEAVSKVVQCLCHRGFTDFKFTETTMRVIQTLERGGGL